MSLEFERLPLLEVYARFSLGKELPVSLPFLLDLAVRIGDPFNLPLDIGSLDAPPGQQAVVNLDPGLCHGIKLQDQDRHLTLQVQDHLIGVRWNSDAPVDNMHAAARPYPRYGDGLKPSLALLYGRLVDMLGEEGVVPTVANMVYTNFIATEQENGMQRLQGLFRDFVPPQVARGRKVHEIMNSWLSDKGVDVRTHAQVGDVNNPESGRAVGFVFKSSAGLKIPEGTTPFDALDLVHEQACSTFEELLTDQALKEWVKK